MKKQLALALAGIMVAGSLSACGSSGSETKAPETTAKAAESAVKEETPAAKEETTAAESSAEAKENADKPSGKITFLTNTAYGDVPQNLANEYMKTNPNAEVVLESYSRTELMKVIDIKVGAGKADYDVLFVDQPLVASYYWKDYLLPLNDYFTDDELSLITDADKNAGFVEGDLEAVPLTSSSMALMVNMDLLKEAGLSMDDAIVNRESRITWEQLQDLAKQFQDKMDPDHTKGMWGLLYGQAKNPYQILALGNSLGEKAVADDGVTVDGVLNTDGWVKALTFYQNCYNEWGITPKGSSDDEVKELFYSGKGLFYVANTSRAKAADFEVAGMLHPAFEGGTATIPTGSWYLGINKNSANTDLAVDFMKYCTVGDGAEYFMISNNQVPARKDLLQNIVDGKYTEFAEWPGLATAIGAKENLDGNGYMRPTTYGWDSFDSKFSNALADIQNGSDVKTTLDNVTSSLQADFEQYK